MKRERASVVGYARGTGSNVADQVKALEKHTEEVLIDVGKAPGPKLDAVIRALRPGETLAVVRASCVAKNVFELLALLAKLQDRKAEFACLEQPALNMDWTPETRIKTGILAALVQMQKEAIEEARLAGIRRAAAEWKYKANAGRPKKYDREVMSRKIEEMRELDENPKNIAKKLGIALSTLYLISPPERKTAAKKNPGKKPRKRWPAKKSALRKMSDSR